MSITITHVSELTTMTCAKCGGGYAIAESFRSEASRIGNFTQGWHCPYCQTRWSYGESDADKLKAQIGRLQTDIERKEAEKRDYAERNARLVASRNACRGHFNRVCRRIKAGVCPCCNRTFSNLASHMKTKHPDMQTEPTEPTEPLTP
jgi:predicted trehalose synthase